MQIHGPFCFLFKLFRELYERTKYDADVWRAGEMQVFGNRVLM